MFLQLVKNADYNSTAHWPRMDILQLLQADLYWFSPRNRLRCSINRLNNDTDFIKIWTHLDAGEMSPGAIKEQAIRKHQMHIRTTCRPSQHGTKCHHANHHESEDESQIAFVDQKQRQHDDGFYCINMTRVIAFIVTNEQSRTFKSTLTTCSTPSEPLSQWKARNAP